jgi:hypothetical protein
LNLLLLTTVYELLLYVDHLKSIKTHPTHRKRGVTAASTTPYQFLLQTTNEFRSIKVHFIDYPEENSSSTNQLKQQLTEVCAYCKFGSSCGIAKCSRCGSVPYCCSEHQRKHWKIHSKDCLSVWADLTEKGF